jgi:hypothetical protein
MKIKCLNCKLEHEVYWYVESDTKRTAMTTCNKVGRLVKVEGFHQGEKRYHLGRVDLEVDQLKKLGITPKTELPEEWSGKYAKTKQSRDQMEMMPLLRKAMK